jgi:hypothetical protein
MAVVCTAWCLVCWSAVYVDELRRREREMGIDPDPEVDALLKAEAVEGKRSNIVTDIMLRLLGLEVRGLLRTGACVHTEAASARLLAVPETCWWLLLSTVLHKLCSPVRTRRFAHLCGP